MFLILVVCNLLFVVGEVVVIGIVGVDICFGDVLVFILGVIILIFVILGVVIVFIGVILVIGVGVLVVIEVGDIVVDWLIDVWVGLIFFLVVGIFEVIDFIGVGDICLLVVVWLIVCFCVNIFFDFKVGVEEYVFIGEIIVVVVFGVIFFEIVLREIFWFVIEIWLVFKFIVVVVWLVVFVVGVFIFIEVVVWFFWL